MTVKDVSTLQVRPDDLVYLDPPYTKRQYASYYHIMETLALYDNPTVQGTSGLRPWRDKASDYCYKRKALIAITKLVASLNSKHILLSYSEDGHIPIEELKHTLTQIGTVQICELGELGRYRPNKVASSTRSSVQEYLVSIHKNPPFAQ